MNTPNPKINDTARLPRRSTRKKPMELLIIPGFIVIWIVLQIWILPKMGVST